MKLRHPAIEIWRAGVAAVESERLVRSHIEAGSDGLVICGESFPVEEWDRLVVVGAGKAGAGMAAAIEQALAGTPFAERTSGWVNVPADCVRELERITLHAARPAGVNEPTEEGVAGAEEILQRVRSLGPRDLCVVLLSGGGSALLPAPAEGITLADKQAVTRLLMHSGASIDELNCVRKHLSRIKGGQLARACTAGRMICLIISDVIGDPLDTIASGPTVADPTTPAEALDILKRYSGTEDDVPAAVWQLLEERTEQHDGQEPFPEHVINRVIGNNRVALDAAAERARALGFAVHDLGTENRGEAERVGIELAELCLSVRDQGQPVPAPVCVLSGGEPVVNMSPSGDNGKGGRNQELAVAALHRIGDAWDDRIVILSGGTDGEDGPTDAAGGIADRSVHQEAGRLQLSAAEAIRRHDAWPFLSRTGGLLKTGPTHTNVMDLRVALIVPPTDA